MDKTKDEFDQKLLKYIDKNIGDEKQEDALRSELLMGGHDVMKIENHIEHVKMLHKKRSRRLKIISIVAGSILIFIIILSIVLYLTTGSILPNYHGLNQSYDHAQEQAADPMSLCNQISSEKERLSCIDDVILKTATENNDASLCMQIMDNTKRNNCQDAVLNNNAVNQNNIELCAKIHSQEAQNGCKAVVLNNIAMNNKNSSLCEQIEIMDLRNACLDNLIQARAIDELNESLCNQISDKESADSCTEIVLKSKASLER